MQNSIRCEQYTVIKRERAASVSTCIKTEHMMKSMMTNDVSCTAIDREMLDACTENVMETWEEKAIA